MKRMTAIAAASLAAAFLLALGGMAARAQVPKAAPGKGSARGLPAAGIAGRYLADGDAKQALTITLLMSGTYRLTADEWDGVGLFDGRDYWGVYRYREGSS